MLRLVAPSLNLDPNGENFPLSVKPEKELSIRDVLDIFCDTCKDTPFDMTQTLTVVDREGKTVKSPWPIPL